MQSRHLEEDEFIHVRLKRSALERLVREEALYVEELRCEEQTKKLLSAMLLWSVSQKYNNQQVY
ncbi:hypothetical protein OE749_14400 [Aestuariibacter sp. AA17]|uniref:Uncharacterized protein n=1 Tax=Fluctibacter corallii TaxID=2984329 RepID=A0ABT3AC81_9ALTE|nr:hypothetical protein [Aestuariibacter sp. AA17]MCV2885886.1 hypothetical protein [Aestuariibacter sp. AA17]